MPYTTDNPPDRIKALPPHAQKIWVTAFNAALDEYKDEGKANATAWSAVEKAGYKKDENGEWHKRAVDIKSIWESIKQLFEPFMNDSPPEVETPTQRIEFLPLQTRALTVTRQADGKPRWLMIAASAVVNKANAIDSTMLFDNFIRHAQEAGEYPTLDFLHERDTIRFVVDDCAVKSIARLQLAQPQADLGNVAGRRMPAQSPKALEQEVTRAPFRAV